MVRRFFVLAVVPTLVSAQETIDRAMVAKIRDEGLNRSRAWAMVDTLATVIGPRLTASPAYMRAATWAKDHFASWGLTNSHLESWPFGRGWELQKFTLEMTEPRFAPMVGYPDAWSPSTNGDVVGTPILIAGMPYDSLDKMRGRLKGAIVLTQPLMTTFIREDRINPTASNAPPDAPPQPAAAGRGGRGGGRGGAPSDAQRIAALLKEVGVGAVLKTSRGEHGTIFLQTRDAGQTPFRPSSSPASNTTTSFDFSKTACRSRCASTCRAGTSLRTLWATTSSPKFRGPTRGSRTKS
jgi:carboxypeptidase Q